MSPRGEGDIRVLRYSTNIVVLNLNSQLLNIAERFKFIHACTSKATGEECAEKNAL